MIERTGVKVKKVNHKARRLEPGSSRTELEARTKSTALPQREIRQSDLLLIARKSGSTRSPGLVLGAGDGPFLGAKWFQMLFGRSGKKQLAFDNSFLSFPNRISLVISSSGFS